MVKILLASGGKKAGLRTLRRKLPHPEEATRRVQAGPALNSLCFHRPASSDGFILRYLHRFLGRSGIREDPLHFG